MKYMYIFSFNIPALCCTGAASSQVLCMYLGHSTKGFPIRLSGSTDLFSDDSNRTWGNSKKLRQERVKLDIISSLRGWSGTGRGSQGSSHCTDLQEFKMHLDNALDHMILFWVILCTQKMNTMILMGPFPLGKFYDSMIPILL